MRTRVPLATAAILALAALVAPRPLLAQGPDSAFYAGFKWRNIGPPNMSGRITDVEGVPGTATFYVASVAGGIWKTTNNGTTFKPLFDVGRVASMGDLAIAPSDPNVLYAGTGEEDSRNSISPGGGVYVSRDGGESWTFSGLKETQAIGRIVVHPSDPNTAWVAALGHIWGANQERGVYKTTDGGKTWRRVKFISDRAGFVDLALDPRDPDVLWASSWERVRGPWFLESGGPGSGLWKSTDGGERWTEVTGGGFPSTEKGRIGIAMAASDPDVMYALVEAKADDTKGMSDDDAASSGLKGTGLYRSADGGHTWRWMNGVDTRPFYYSQVRVAPDDPDLVFWSSTPVQFSKDGGKTVGEATIGIHVDHHAMWWDASNPDHFIVGNDGGIAVTWDRGGTYDFVNTLPIGQFYHVSYDMSVPYRVCGGLQDNGTWCGPSRRARGGIDHHMWYTVSGGDGFYSQQDPTDPATVYAESQGGSMSRVNLVTGERSRMGKPEWQDRARPILDSIAVHEGVKEPREMTAAEQAKVEAWKKQAAEDSATYDLRYNWNTPIVLSPHAPHTIYTAGNRVLMSTDRGDTFKVISPDLTTRDPEKIEVSTKTTGGITKDVTGAETHATIVALAESPLVEGLLFAGTDDGNVWMRRPGAEWQQIRPKLFKGVPEHTWVSRIEPSHFDPQRFYVTFDGHRSDHFAPYVFVTNDGGGSFRTLAAGLPAGGPDFVHVVREDLVNPDLLFVGTDVGAYVSTDRGATWRRFMEGLPTVPVHDLEIHPRDHELIAATHGRSIWIVDIAPLQQLSTVRLADSPVLFAPAPGLEFGDAPSGGESTGHRYFEGESAPFGAEIAYYVPEGWTPPATRVAGDTDAPLGGPRPDVGTGAAGATVKTAGDTDLPFGGPGRPGSQRPERGARLKLAVLGAAGDTVATLEGPASPGLHRVTWNLQKRSEGQEPKSPSEVRDSIRADAAMVEVADSLVAHEGLARAAADRAIAMLRSGDRSRMWGGRGAGGGTTDRPGERYPEPKAESGPPAAGAGARAAQAAKPSGEVESPPAEGAKPSAEQTPEPSQDDIRGAMRQIFSAMRERGVRMSFRGGSGGGPGLVADGRYTVALPAGDETVTRPITVVRAAGFDPAAGGSELLDEEWLEP